MGQGAVRYVNMHPCTPLLLLRPQPRRGRPTHTLPTLTTHQQAHIRVPHLRSTTAGELVLVLVLVDVLVLRPPTLHTAQRRERCRLSPVLLVLVSSCGS